MSFSLYRSILGSHDRIDLADFAFRFLPRSGLYSVEKCRFRMGDLGVGPASVVDIDGRVRLLNRFRRMNGRKPLIIDVDALGVARFVNYADVYP